MGNELLGFQTAQQSAILKGVTYLFVQFVTVGQYHYRWGAFKLSPDFLSQEHHRITLARALGVPEHTELTFHFLTMAIHLHGLIHTEVLVVACQNLHRRTTAMVEENEVFKQIQQVLFLADTSKHRWQFDVAMVQFRQSFPLMKELPL